MACISCKLPPTTSSCRFVHSPAFDLLTVVHSPQNNPNLVTARICGLTWNSVTITGSPLLNSAAVTTAIQASGGSVTCAGCSGSKQFSCQDLDNCVNLGGAGGPGKCFDLP